MIQLGWLAGLDETPATAVGQRGDRVVLTKRAAVGRPAAGARRGRRCSARRPAGPRGGGGASSGRSSGRGRAAPQPGARPAAVLAWCRVCTGRERPAVPGVAKRRVTNPVTLGLSFDCSGHGIPFRFIGRARPRHHHRHPAAMRKSGCPDRRWLVSSTNANPARLSARRPYARAISLPLFMLTVPTTSP